MNFAKLLRSHYGFILVLIGYVSFAYAMAGLIFKVEYTTSGKYGISRYYEFNQDLFIGLLLVGVAVTTIIAGISGIKAGREALKLDSEKECPVKPIRQGID